jgi:DNA-binding NtrC family response regulator
MLNNYMSAMKVFQRDLIVRTLAIHRGNQVETAQALGIHRNTLHRMIRVLKINVDDIKNRGLIHGALREGGEDVEAQGQ